MADYAKFTIYGQKDTATGAYPISSTDRDYSKLRSAIKSALPEDAEILESVKTVSKLGRTVKSFYVIDEYATNVARALKDINQKIIFSGKDEGGEEKYKITKARKLTADDMDFIRAEEQKRRTSSDNDNKDNKNKEDSDSKEKTAVALFTKSSLLKIIVLLISLGETVRRLFSAVLDLSIKTVKDMTTAHNIGLPYDYVRKASYTEIAHGMKEGTITEAITEIQSKFGNITKLDETAISDLALVMGGKVEELVKAGLGSSDPDKLLGAIIDSFNERANAGYNSIGQYVGEQQARRELYSYLLKISPAWADIFATMQEEQHNINSIFRDQAETFEQWKNLVPLNRDFGATSMDYNVTATLGQEWNVLKSDIEQIKNGILVSLAQPLLNILRRLENNRIGMSESESRQLDIRNRALNQAEIERVSDIIAIAESMEGTLNPNELAQLSYLREYKEDLEKENKKRQKVMNAVQTPDEIRLNALSKIKDFYAPYEHGFFGTDQTGAMTSLGEDYWTFEGMGMTKLTMQDVEDYAKAKNIDLEGIKQKYIAERQSEKEEEYKEEMDIYNLKIKNAVNKEYSTKSKELTYSFVASSTGWTNTAKAKSILNFMQGLLGGKVWNELFADSENLTAIEKLGKLRDAGYLKLQKGKGAFATDYTIDVDKFVDKEDIERRAKEGLALPVLDIEAMDIYGKDMDDFIEYFLQNQWIYSPKDSMLSARKDKYVAESETENRLSALYLARDELQKAMAELGMGTYAVSSEQVKTNGEVELRVKVDFTDAKGRTEHRDLGSYLNETGYTGLLVQAKVDADGMVTYTDATAPVGTPASGGIKNGK